MVYSACFSPLSSGGALKNLGAADSKVLTEKQRDGLFDKIKAHPEDFGYVISVLSPQYLSAAMLRRFLPILPLPILPSQVNI